VLIIHLDLHHFLARPTMADTKYPILLVVAGVSGSGKSTFGIQLARRLNIPFIDGDDLHPPSNIEKMKHGIALEDADREPWLDSIRTKALEIIAHPSLVVNEEPTHNHEKPHAIVVACSALKRKYRDILRRPPENESSRSRSASSSWHVHFIYLQGDPELIKQRLENRKNHFVGSDMLTSQLETLEEPDPSQEDSDHSKIITIPVSSLADGKQPKSVEDMVDEAVQKLERTARFPTEAVYVGAKSSFQLPPIKEIFDSEPTQLHDVLALLFEVSDSIDNKLIPILREQAGQETCPNSYSELIDRCEQIVENQFSCDERVNFLGSHPRIGEVKGLSKLSSQEQGNQTDPEILVRLEQLNTIYETVYPQLRYVTFVNGRSRSEIVKEMESFLVKSIEFSNDDRQKAIDYRMELARGISEVFKIAKSRLKTMTEASNP